MMKSSRAACRVMAKTPRAAHRESVEGEPSAMLNARGEARQTRIFAEDVGERAFEVGVEELEVVFEQAFGQTAPAREREFGFRPHEERAEAHETFRHARAPRP